MQPENINTLWRLYRKNMAGRRPLSRSIARQSLAAIIKSCQKAIDSGCREQWVLDNARRASLYASRHFQEILVVRVS